MSSIASIEAADGVLLILGLVFVVVSLVTGFAGGRPKNHWIRQRARARRRAARIA